jgi:SAM-dependent methyltransferase
MPSLEDNYWAFEVAHDWSRGGEEWSDAWGGTEIAWRTSVFPRIREFLDAGLILEIGSGQGRWTHYLQQHAQRVFAVDISPKCIEFCKRRFAEQPHVECLVNDGMSLGMIEDASVDFIFSFDSLVHADPPVLEAYARQAGHKLKPGAFGFIHHSNLGAYLPKLPRKQAANEHWRSRTMTAELFRGYCAGAGLQCIRQELINWGGTKRLGDCFSIFVKDANTNECHIVENRMFMDEVNRARKSRLLQVFFKPLHRTLHDISLMLGVPEHVAFACVHH